MAHPARSRQPGSGRTYFVLSGDQRRFFLGAATACAVAGVAATLPLRPWTGHWPGSDGLWFAGFASLIWATSLYYLRVAYGWVLVDAAGLRTSRLIRGRSVQWNAVQKVTTRRYYGRGGGVTVVKVHTTRGRTFTLPAPRTTMYDDREFDRAVRHLRSRVPGTPGLQRHRRLVLMVTGAGRASR